MAKDGESPNPIYATRCERLPATAYLAPEGFLPQLQRALPKHPSEPGLDASIYGTYDRLVVAPGPLNREAATWAENIWYEPMLITAPSIGSFAKELRSLQRTWQCYSWQLHRRHALLQDKLPFFSAKTLTFPQRLPQAPLGSCCFLAEHTLLASAKCSSPFTNGVLIFAQPELSGGPPSKAYLKLWELFTRLQLLPQQKSKCLELGASPGGWTWVLASLGAEVQGYDRAPLDPYVASMPGVSLVQKDAFGALPQHIGRIDWLFSDVICYPEKLLDFIRIWLASGLCQNYVCTMKFQGESHYGVIKDLLSIPGSQLLHLHANKHELTWALIDPNSPAVKSID